MSISQLIWFELVYAAYWEQYISGYISHKYDHSKTYACILLVLSTVGASSFKLWELVPQGTQWMPVALFSVMAIVQLLSVLQRNVTLGAETENKLRELREQYLSYFFTLQRLYLELVSGAISEEEARERFFVALKARLGIERLKDSLHIKKLRKPHARGQREMETRLARMFGTGETSEPLAN